MDPKTTRLCFASTETWTAFKNRVSSGFAVYSSLAPSLPRIWLTLGPKRNNKALPSTPWISIWRLQQKRKHKHAFHFGACAKWELNAAEAARQQHQKHSSNSSDYRQGCLHVHSIKSIIQHTGTFSTAATLAAAAATATLATATATHHCQQSSGSALKL